MLVDYTALTIPESFGSRLQRLRKERGLTLAQLGERLEVTKPTVWAWEKGKSRPLKSRIAPIAEVLGVTTSELTDVSEPAGVNDAVEMREFLVRSREAIAHVFGTDPRKVRIIIEL